MKKILIILTVAFFASCSNNLENLNQNIKDPAIVSGESLFTGAQKSLVDQVVDLNVNNNNTKLWSQYLQETTYLHESRYDQVRRTIPTNHWSVLYKDVLKDLDQAKKSITATDYLLAPEQDAKANKLQVIELLTIYTYSLLVETFGNVPYTEALDIKNLLPKYDDGSTVYEDLIVRLTAAIDGLDTSKGSFDKNSDFIYAGNVVLWKKFAASLKLRMGILLSDSNAALAKSTVESAITSGVFTSNTDNADYKYLSAAPNTNPVHNNLILSGRQDFVAAKTIVDMMNTLGDYRRPKYFKTIADGTYKGGGIGESSDFDGHSHVSAIVEEATAPGVLLDYAEVEFLLAEAAARTFTVGGTAKEHYDLAIKASFEDWGLSATDATSYLAQPNVDYDTVLAASTATTAWKEVIGNQKWISLFNRGLEAWTSIRLLDFPALPAPLKAVSGFPNRYTYPKIEQTLNGANYTNATTAIGTDTAEQKLFWDKF